MRPIIRVDIVAGTLLVAQAFLAPGNVPRIAAVDGTAGDLCLIRAEAFGADNVTPIDPHAFFSQLVAAFPPGLASAFGAYAAVPSFGP